MLKSNVIVAASGKLKKDKEESDTTAEQNGMDIFKLHIGCIDPLSKAIQSMKDCLGDLQDEGLKTMLMTCIESTGKIEEELLKKAGEALRGEILSIRSAPADSAAAIADIAGKIAGDVPMQVPAPQAAPAEVQKAAGATHGQKS